MADDVPEAAREEVVDAVRRALAKHGYAGLTTRRVAAESEKSEAFFFYHYDTKDDLVLAFVDWAADRLASRLEDVDDTDPVTRLYAVVDCLLPHPDDDAVDPGVNVAMMELLSHAPFNDAFHERLSAYERAVLDDLAGVLREGVRQGLFRDVDPEATGAFLLMASDGTAGAVMALGMTDVGEATRERAFDYLDRVVLVEGVDPPTDVP
jgi:AcrR family transcriptional regulator